jgi:hypothetical protein
MLWEEENVYIKPKGSEQVNEDTRSHLYATSLPSLCRLALAFVLSCVPLHYHTSRAYTSLAAFTTPLEASSTSCWTPVQAHTSSGKTL